MNLTWSHGGLAGDAEGVVWASVAAPAGETFLAGGGFVDDANATATRIQLEQALGNLHQFFPVLGGAPYYNAGANQWQYDMVFSVPPGDTVTVHMWITSTAASV